MCKKKIIFQQKYSLFLRNPLKRTEENPIILQNKSEEIEIAQKIRILDGFQKTENPSSSSTREDSINDDEYLPDLIKKGIRKYQKISSQKKKLYIQRFMNEPVSMFTLAKKMNLNYSSAKKIINDYRAKCKTLNKRIFEDLQEKFSYQVQVSPITDKNYSNIQIICTNGGSQQVQ